MKETFVLMRFYEGGGLAQYEIVSCGEDDLYECLVKFEQDCVSQNLGVRIGILEKKEFDSIAKEIEETR